MRPTLLTTLCEPSRRIATVALGTVAALGMLSAPAQASTYNSHLTGAGPGFESTRWNDNGGATNIKFTGCTDDYSNQRVSVRLRKDTFGPDPSYTNASFTQCFVSSSSTSSGNWDDHGSGEYYFVVNDALVGVHVWVKSLTVTY
ncbi:hypothetical protein ACFCV8_13850 [Streptomyces sp. NPDC056347]|uniref:hypothetical protein n=1 Tax=Streptomyces sp. NPDC056347 TaxID=3345790 RepID=UPI0035DD254E